MAGEEGDGEVDLCLELSIGGRSSGRKAAGAGVVLQKSQDLEGMRGEGGAGDGVRGVVAAVEMPALICMDGGDATDSLRKREVHAMRRQEARKKREEKQQRKGIGRRTNSAGGAGPGQTIGAGDAGGVGCHGLSGRTCSPDDRTVLEAQEYQLRARDREARESEDYPSERKGAERGQETLSLASSLSSNPNLNQSPRPNCSPKANPDTSHPLNPYGPFPVVPMQYPFHLAHFVPFPYMMPYWNPQLASGADGTVPGKNGVFQPVACRTFWPFQPSPTNKNEFPLGGCEGTETYGGETNGGNDACIKRVPSLAEGSSFSAISKYQSRSFEGGSSSADTQSRSSRGLVQKQFESQPSSPLTNPAAHSEYSISSDQADKETTQKPTEELTGKQCVPNSTQTCPKVPLEGNQTDKPVADGNPKKQLQGSSLPQMPCVSTTGNGPNGKTITGFLYRYNEKEVSIMCVCHGSSFTPAEFIKHAGGTEVACPLKHILVVSS